MLILYYKFYNETVEPVNDSAESSMYNKDLAFESPNWKGILPAVKHFCYKLFTRSNFGHRKNSDYCSSIEF